MLTRTTSHSHITPHVRPTLPTEPHNYGQLFPRNSTLPSNAYNQPFPTHLTSIQHVRPTLPTQHTYDQPFLQTSTSLSNTYDQLPPKPATHNTSRTTNSLHITPVVQPTLTHTTVPTNPSQTTPHVPTSPSQTTPHTTLAVCREGWLVHVESVLPSITGDRNSLPDETRTAPSPEEHQSLL